MSTIAGGLGLGAGAASAAYSAKQQYKYAKRMALNSPGWNVQGLKDAGLNPILAANPAGGSPSAGMPSVDMSLPSVAASSAKSAAEKKLADANTDIANNNAITSAANAADAMNRMRWNEKTYNYMQSENDGFLLKMSALKNAGYSPKDLGEAGVLNILMNNKTNAKKAAKPKPKPSVPEYMGVPIWR